MKKRVLLVGSGGREHALAWKLCQSPELGKLYVAPGNAGTNKIASNVPIEAIDIPGLLKFALKEKIDLTVVGPDDPLANGIVDIFQAYGLHIFGPTQAAAQIEASKVFSKRLMRSSGVPTAPFKVIGSSTGALVLARKHFRKSDESFVLKADGLALGKGVYICKNLTEARTAIDEIMIRRIHGSAGNRVIAEDFAEGLEVTTHVFCDGKSYKLFPSAQDHKPIFNGDEGPNTGGMGAIAPVPWFTIDHKKFVEQRILDPILHALREIGRPFVGLLYPGLKVPSEGPVVLEFNARFGDPETQVYMPLLKTDLLEIFEACVNGQLHKINVEWNPGFAACIVMASVGYPAPDYKKGMVITGIDRAETLPGVVVFHAGTKYVDGKLVTSGGRVLGVTGIGLTLYEAINRAYNGVECIHFEGMQYRRDIGVKSL